MIDRMQQHYGFTVMPFTAAIPVPALFGSAAHKEAVARLRWLISARGLGVITGEVGSGKTAAARAAVSGLDPSRHTLIYLPNPQIGMRGIHAPSPPRWARLPASTTPPSSPRSRRRWPPKPTRETGTPSWPSTKPTCSPTTSSRRSACSPTTTSTPVRRSPPCSIGQPTLRRRPSASASWPPWLS